MRCTTVAAAVAAAIVFVGGAAAKPEPQWQAAPSFRMEDQSIVWPGGRLAFLKGNDEGGPSAGGYTVHSAPVAAGRIGPWTKTSAAAARGYVAGVVDQDVVFRYTPALDPEEALRAMKLLPNGRLGPPRPVGGAPPPPSSNGSSFAQLPDRAVQLVGIDTGKNYDDPGVCCDADGEAVNLLKLKLVPQFSDARLGVDKHGRLWYAWAPVGSGRPGMVQLDPFTLLPRSKPQLVPGITLLRGAARSLRDLLCADSCRMVIQGMAGARQFGDFSWAPGESAATRLRLPTKYPGSIEYGSVDGTHLVVAYWFRDAKNAVYVGVARGDAKGRRLRAVSSIEQPQALGSATIYTRVVVGTFGRGGFAAVSAYENNAVRVAILPTG